MTNRELCDKNDWEVGDLLTDGKTTIKLTGIGEDFVLARERTTDKDIFGCEVLFDLRHRAWSKSINIVKSDNGDLYFKDLAEDSLYLGIRKENDLVMCRCDGTVFGHFCSDLANCLGDILKHWAKTGELEVPGEKANS
jgi:hypothetical protein